MPHFFISPPRQHFLTKIGALFFYDPQIAHIFCVWSCINFDPLWASPEANLLGGGGEITPPQYDSVVSEASTIRVKHKIYSSVSVLATVIWVVKHSKAHTGGQLLDWGYCTVSVRKHGRNEEHAQHKHLEAWLQYLRIKITY